MTTLTLGAFAYIVPDYDAGIAFFTALGWRLAEDVDQGHKRWVTVTDGHIKLVLAQADGPAQRAAIGAQFAGRVGLFLYTDDFAAAAARIVAAGGQFQEAPRRESYGTVAVWTDPWGTRWDLIEATSGQD
ncbi:extradiol dioxygenase [Jannaschia pagri]|uniref:Extradiol dioxygenase n=1 Tax=Jannaschia pagri TaxID=2829797 RepID=A0ABQ4NHP5_9RHOB|nr:MULTISPECIES: VOC family protein [unclassified Jannaschia]GIT89942.1 extradiol dioxygenase [Jannaschia sp. AI_61]GIT93951.1 extradiol dioxygenase [Jannaschia sp. AI_62]